MAYNYFHVAWVTRTRYVSRHYSRDFETETEATAFAIKKKRTNPLVEALTVREMNYDDNAPFVDGKGQYHKDGGLRVSIVRQIAWWK